MDEQDPRSPENPDDEEEAEILERVHAFVGVMRGEMKPGRDGVPRLEDLVRFPLLETLEWRGELQVEMATQDEVQKREPADQPWDIEMVDYEMIWLSPLLVLVQLQSQATPEDDSEPFDFMSFYVLGRTGSRKGKKLWQVLLSWQGEFPEDAFRSGKGAN